LDLNTKQQWVVRIRELIQENDLYHDLSIHEPNFKQQQQAHSQQQQKLILNINNADR